MTVTADQGVLANDYDLDGDPITPQLVSSPLHGTLQLNADGSLTYKPFAGFTGTDTFRYLDFDGLATSPAVPVVIDVQHAISLFPPDDQANNEGDSVNLQFPATDANGRAMTWTATGLPPDVSIDPNTGIFTGTVSYSAGVPVTGLLSLPQVPTSSSGPKSGSYPVTVTVTDGQDTVTANFNWFITDTNRLTQPDNQVNEPGDVVSLQLQATGGPFTFAAAGLPAGLSINSTTGLISGTITERPTQPRTHTVTVSITGAGSTDSQQFQWAVLNAKPSVEIAINDTVSTDDDFTANLQPIPARVTLHDKAPGKHKVEIVVPSGLSTIQNGTLMLSDGESAEITIVPKKFSQKEDDVLLVALDDGKKAGQAAETNAKITVTQHITNPDTPKGMPDRIPPREFTTIQVMVDPVLKGKKLVAAVANGSNENGFADFASALPGGLREAVSWTTGKGGSLYIAGVAGHQTDPGFAGNLVVEIRNAKGTVLTKSLGFSVAAIPVAVKVTSVRKLVDVDLNNGEGNSYAMFFGAEYSMTYISDSGFVSDLDFVTVKEIVTPDGKPTGFFSGLATQTSGFISAIRPAQADHLGIQVLVKRTDPANGEAVPLQTAQRAAFAFFTLRATKNKGQGTVKEMQSFVFVDARTGMQEDSPAPIANSGFMHDKMLSGTQPPYTITVTKTPLAFGEVMPGQMPVADTKPQPIKIIKPFA